MFKDELNMADRLTLTVERDGKVIDVVEPFSTQGFFGKLLCNLGLKKYTTDLVVTAGLASITDFLVTEYTHMAIGTGVASPAMANTTLGTETMRVAFDSATQETTTYTNDTARFVSTFTLDNDYAITEMGTFNDATVGTMLQRQTFAVLNLKEGDVLTITLDIVMS